MLIAFHILWIVNVIIVFRCRQLSFKSARTIAASYYRGAHGIIVAFDVTAARLKLCLNFSELIKWLTFEKWHCAYFAHICHTVQSVAVSGPVCGAFTIRNIINISSSKWISGPGILQECPAMDARDWQICSSYCEQDAGGHENRSCVETGCASINGFGHGFHAGHRSPGIFCLASLLSMFCLPRCQRKKHGSWRTS